MLKKGVAVLSRQQDDLNLFTVIVLAPVPYGSYSQIVDTLKSELRDERGMIVYFVYARGFAGIQISNALYEIFREQVDLLVTVGVQCTLITRAFLEQNQIPTPHLATGVDLTYVDSLAPSEKSFITVSYDYVSEYTYAPFLKACKPNAKHVLCPFFRDPHSGWSEDFAQKIQMQFVDQGIQVQLLFSSDKERFAQSLLEHYDACDTILLAESAISLDFHRLCASLVLRDRKTLFSGNIDDVRHGGAAIGYGGNFTVLADAVSGVIRTLASHHAQSSKLRQNPIESIDVAQFSTHVKVARMCAVNESIAEAQGLNRDTIVAACLARDGVVYSG